MNRKKTGRHMTEGKKRKQSLISKGGKCASCRIFHVRPRSDFAALVVTKRGGGLQKDKLKRVTSRPIRRKEPRGTEREKRPKRRKTTRKMIRLNHNVLFLERKKNKREGGKKQKA